MYVCMYVCMHAQTINEPHLPKKKDVMQCHQHAAVTRYSVHGIGHM